VRAARGARIGGPRGAQGGVAPDHVGEVRVKQGVYLLGLVRVRGRGRGRGRVYPCP